MSLSYTPISELEAVNQILATVGEASVSTLNSPGVSVATLAQTFLHDASRAIQEMGLACNTEEEFPLLPNDSDSYIYLPSNTLKVDPSYSYNNYVQRGTKLYDRDNHTYIISKKVLVDIVFFLAFDELPQVVRRYITIKAARQFQARWVSSDIIHKLTEQDEAEARATLLSTELAIESCSIFDDPSTYNMVRRY